MPFEIREKIRQKLIQNCFRLGHDIFDLAEDIVYEKTDTKRPSDAEETKIKPNTKLTPVESTTPDGEETSEDTEAEEAAPGPEKKKRKDTVLY